MVEQEYKDTELLMKTLVSHDNIIYDYLYAMDDSNSTRNNVANQRWQYILKKAEKLTCSPSPGILMETTDINSIP